MSESNKALIRRFYDAYNLGDWAHLDGVVAADYVHHNNASRLSFEQFKQGAAWIRRGMPDYRIAIEEMLADGDRVVIRFVGRGTHQGSLYGEAPTGNAVVVYGCIVHRVLENQIAEDWEYIDEQYVKQQLNAGS